MTCPTGIWSCVRWDGVAPGPSCSACMPSAVLMRVDRMAKDLQRNRLVAIKRLIGPFSSVERAKCCFREVHLLRHLHHPNVSQLYAHVYR